MLSPLTLQSVIGEGKRADGRKAMYSKQNWLILFNYD